MHVPIGGNFGGLFLFVPLMRDLRLTEVLRQADLPGSVMIPAAQAVRTLLALKLLGKERKSHVMDLVADQGIALFAGLNVVPKRSYLAAYSSSVDERGITRLMAAWFTEVSRAGLRRGTSLDLDFHTVPANSQEEPLEKHYVSRRSRSQKGILTFLARDAARQALCYARAGITKAQKPQEKDFSASSDTPGVVGAYLGPVPRVAGGTAPAPKRGDHPAHRREA
jgi:hypothetical protein